MAILGVAYNQIVNKPLASRMRPKTVSEIVGHSELLVDGSPLMRLVTNEKSRSWSSIILWGPPGSGKTTIARLLSDAEGTTFVELSAVGTSVSQVREVIDAAKSHLRYLIDQLFCLWTKFIAFPNLNKTPCWRL